MAQDYYEILGISKNASPEEIKRAYRRLAQKYHPDKSGGDEKKFKEVNEAYQILSDPQKRSQYDQFGTTFEQAQASGDFTGFNGFRDFSSFADAFDFFSRGGRQRENFGFGFEEIFEDVFGAGPRVKEKIKTRGNDISIDIDISLEEAFSGTEKILDLYKGVICSKCGGTGAEPGSRVKDCPSCRGVGRVEERKRAAFFTFSQVRTCQECYGRGKVPEKKCSRCGGDGRVKEEKKIKLVIPAGINDGQVISLGGQGEAGLFGGPTGDLYITVHILPHSFFKRRGDDLYYNLIINFTQAALGDKLEIPLLDGKIKIKIPAGIQIGSSIKISGKGMPRMRARGRGDFYVNIDMKIPRSLTPKAKKLLEELKKEIE